MSDAPWTERVCRFGPAGDLVGILTLPAGAGSGPAHGVVLLNAGVVHRVGPHRIHVAAARRLAAEGHPVLRFDLSGVGDSGPPDPSLGPGESVVRDVRSAIDTLISAAGGERCLLSGICSGAIDAFEAARADDRVGGVFMVDGYAYRTPRYHLRHYARRLFRPESWRNVLAGRNPAGRRVRSLLGLDADGGGSSQPLSVAEATGGFEFPPRQAFARRAAALVDRGTRLCFVYTGSWDDFYNARSQLREAFPELARRPEVRVRYLPEADHTFTLARDQERFVELLAGWSAEGAGGAGGAQP